MSFSPTGQEQTQVISTFRIFLQPQWFDYVKEEFKASREGVTMCDYSSFAKLDIWSAGTEVVDFLQYLCSNDVDVPVGKKITLRKLFFVYWIRKPY